LALPTDEPTAFFSYSREDSEFALKLAEDLKAEGANVWLDQLDIEPGQRWARAVQDALNRAQCVLVILSPASVNSNNVEDEVNFALEEHKTVVPVFYRHCKVPFQLRPFQYIDFRTDYDRGLKVMVKTLGVERQSAASVSEVSNEAQQYPGFVVKEAKAVEDAPRYSAAALSHSSWSLMLPASNWGKTVLIGLVWGAWEGGIMCAVRLVPKPNPWLLLFVPVCGCLVGCGFGFSLAVYLGWTSQRVNRPCILSLVARWGLLFAGAFEVTLYSLRTDDLALLSLWANVIGGVFVGALAASPLRKMHPSLTLGRVWIIAVGFGGAGLASVIVGIIAGGFGHWIADVVSGLVLGLIGAGVVFWQLSKVMKT
jgi:hypothetical protein